MDIETAVARMVRTGIVSATNTAERKVRVIFRDDNLTSGWLCVLQQPLCAVAVADDGEHTHAITDTYTGGGSAGTEPDHNHPGTYTTHWMPKVNDCVLVLTIPVFNGDGFVLGGI